MGTAKAVFQSLYNYFQDIGEMGTNRLFTERRVSISGRVEPRLRGFDPTEVQPRQVL